MDDPDYCDGARAPAGRSKRRSLLLPAPLMPGQSLLAGDAGDADENAANGGNLPLPASPDYCDGARAKGARRKRRSLLLPAPMPGQSLLASCDGDGGAAEAKPAAEEKEAGGLAAPETPRTMTRRFVASTSSSEKRSLAEQVRERRRGMEERERERTGRERERRREGVQEQCTCTSTCTKRFIPIAPYAVLPPAHPRSTRPFGLSLRPVPPECPAGVPRRAVRPSSHSHSSHSLRPPSLAPHYSPRPSHPSHPDPQGLGVLRGRFRAVGQRGREQGAQGGAEKDAHGAPAAPHERRQGATGAHRPAAG